MPRVEKTKAGKGAQKPMRIDVKRAVGIAADYFRELFPQAAKANMMLEELEESDDGRFWLVTLGYDVENRAFFGNAPTRSYKTFRINADTGKVHSVKIRSIA
jgi:hypothetical protein